METAPTGAVCALILAAGRGVRFGATANKVFSPLLNRPILSWTLEAFAKCGAIDRIILVAAEGEQDYLREIGGRWSGGKLKAVVSGGSDRQSSVRNGLAACADFEFVAVHDAARPCITSQLISEVVSAAKWYHAATLASPIVDTIVRQTTDVRELFVGDNVRREGLHAIQTPQVFRTSLLIRAHSEAQIGSYNATDDAGLVQRLGIPVKLVESFAQNLKITRPQDMELAEAILRHRQPSPTPPPEDRSGAEGGVTPPFRIGHGYDVHQFAEGRKMFLGGVEFTDSPVGLLGHSDADVVLHALCDALLGAAAMGDIGKLFPPSDMRHKDRRSTEFLDEVKVRLDAANWTVGNVDLTILAEKPKIGPMADTMRAKIAVHLGIEPDQIGIKATTNEGMGFIGRGEGIAAHATVLIVRKT